MVHFSAVKEVVEIESGRFEYFKQMLTIGLAGIAGLAALFSDKDKIPEEFWSKGMLFSFAICAILVVILSELGISTYANHLRDVEKLSRDPANQEFQKNRAGSEMSILHHAQGVLLTSVLGAITLIVFATLNLFQPQAIGAEAAMKIARKVVSEQSGNSSSQILSNFQTVGGDYLVTYSTDTNQEKYTVRISINTHRISEITKLP